MNAMGLETIPLAGSKQSPMQNGVMKPFLDLDVPDASELLMHDEIAIGRACHESQVLGIPASVIRGSNFSINKPTSGHCAPAPREHLAKQCRWTNCMYGWSYRDESFVGSVARIMKAVAKGGGAMHLGDNLAGRWRMLQWFRLRRRQGALYV